MKCPHLIEPHQIQGLDYIHIFPVMQWLVKRSEQNRAEKAERLKAFAIGQFHNYFALKSDQDSKEKYINGTSCVQHIQVHNTHTSRGNWSKVNEANVCYAAHLRTSTTIQTDKCGARRRRDTSPYNIAGVRNAWRVCAESGRSNANQRENGRFNDWGWRWTTD